MSIKKRKSKPKSIHVAGVSEAFTKEGEEQQLGTCKDTMRISVPRTKDGRQMHSRLRLAFTLLHLDHDVHHKLVTRVIKVKQGVIPLVHDVLHSLSSTAVRINLKQG